MSFVEKQLNLRERMPGQAKLLMCAKCEREKVPEGGVQMNPNKWVCASCWTRRAIRRPAK